MTLNTSYILVQNGLYYISGRKYAHYVIQLVNCKDMSVILTNFSYLSCNVYRIKPCFETQKLLEAMKMVLGMPVELSSYLIVARMYYT